MERRVWSAAKRIRKDKAKKVEAEAQQLKIKTLSCDTQFHKHHLNFKYLYNLEPFQFESLKKSKFTSRSQEAMLFGIRKLTAGLNDLQIIWMIKQELSIMMKSEIVNTENPSKAHQRELSKSDIFINTPKYTWYDIELSIKRRKKFRRLQMDHK